MCAICLAAVHWYAACSYLSKTQKCPNEHALMKGFLIEVIIHWGKKWHYSENLNGKWEAGEGSCPYCFIALARV